jgi:hypothetical protein
LNSAPAKQDVNLWSLRSAPPISKWRALHSRRACISNDSMPSLLTTQRIEILVLLHMIRRYELVIWLPASVRPSSRIDHQSPEILNRTLALVAAVISCSHLTKCSWPNWHPFWLMMSKENVITSVARNYMRLTVRFSLGRRGYRVLVTTY